MQFQLLHFFEVLFLQRSEVPSSNTSQDLFELDIIIECIWHTSCDAKNFPQRVNSTENSSWNWTLTPFFYPLWVGQICGLVPDRGLYHLATSCPIAHPASVSAGHVYEKFWFWPEELSFSHKLSRGEDGKSRQDAVSRFRWCHGLIICTAGGST